MKAVRSLAPPTGIPPDCDAHRLGHDPASLGVVDSLPLAVFRVDKNGRLRFLNRHGEGLFGVEAAVALGLTIREAGWPDQGCEPLEKLLADCLACGKDVAVEFRYRGGWYLARIVPEFVADGTIDSMTGAVQEITEQRLREAESELLIRELTHRIKNTLATVQSIASMMRYEKADPDVAFATFEARLAALGDAHSLLADGQWESVPLEQIITTALKPFGHGFQLVGPHLVLKSQAVLTLSMVFHELATNAAKYGALSVPSGRVSVAWSVGVDETKGERFLSLVWFEAGGPPVKPPTRKGFGRILIERGVGFDLKGSARMDFYPDGLCCELIIPARGAFA